MITKEKIIEILSNYSSYADSSLGNIIQEEKHDIIAEDILSKLRQPPVIGSFYFRDFGFENIEFEHTEDETVLIRCNSPEDLVTFEMSKQEAVELALAVLKNCL